MFGLKVIKPTQTLVQPTGNCKELDYYLYIGGWFSHIWGWLRVSWSQSWSISFIYLSAPCIYKCGQFFYTFEGDLYNCGWFLYIWGKFYTFVEIYTFEGPTGSSVGLNLSLNIRLVVLSILCVMRSADTFTSKMNLNIVLILWIGIYQYWPLFIKNLRYWLYL